MCLTSWRGFVCNRTGAFLSVQRRLIICQTQSCTKFVVIKATNLLNFNLKMKKRASELIVELIKCCCETAAAWRWLGNTPAFPVAGELKKQSFSHKYVVEKITVGLLTNQSPSFPALSTGLQIHPSPCIIQYTVYTTCKEPSAYSTYSLNRS